VDTSGAVAKAIGPDITNLQFATPRGVQDATGVNSSAAERVLLIADFTVTLNGIFNDASDYSHDVFKDVSSTSATRTVTIAHSGQTLEVESVFWDYALTRGADGSLTWSAPGGCNEQVVPAWS
jgi:hypothetical protein